MFYPDLQSSDITFAITSICLERDGLMLVEILNTNKLINRQQN